MTEKKSPELPAFVLDPQLGEDLLDALRKGLYVQEACALVGINRSSYSRWKVKAMAGEEPYASFVARVEQAEAVPISTAVNSLLKAADDDWRAAAEWLRRRHGAMWNRTMQAVDPEQAARLDSLDLTSKDAIEDELDELEAIGGADNILKLGAKVETRSSGYSRQLTRRAGGGRNKGQRGAVDPGKVAQAPRPRADGGSGR